MSFRFQTDHCPGARFDELTEEFLDLMIIRRSLVLLEYDPCVLMGAILCADGVIIIVTAEELIRLCPQIHVMPADSCGLLFGAQEGTRTPTPCGGRT